MTQQIALTAAEVELINSQRAAAAALEAEKAAAAEVEFSKKKVAAQSRVSNACKKEEDRLVATENFAKELGSGYTVKTETRTMSEVVKKYDNNFNVIESQEITGTCPYSEIVYNSYTINVAEHISYSGSGWNSRTVNHGFKMYVKGPGIDYKTAQRPYKNPKTVAKIIKDAIEAEQAKVVHAQKQKSAIEEVVAELTAQYPTAEITAKQDYYTTNYGNKPKYIDYNAVVINFENGISVKYRVYADKGMTRMGIEFPHAEAMDVIKALNSIKF